MKHKSYRISSAKTSFIIVLSLLLISCFTFHIIRYSALIPGFSEKNDTLKDRTKTAQIKENTIEGSIIDRNGVIISSSREKGVNGNVKYHSMSSIIGYNDSSGSYGLRDSLSEYLYQPQGNTDTGATAQLSIDICLQEKIYQMLFDQDAACVVLDNHSSEILALVSTFNGIDIDVNCLHENYEEYEEAGFYKPNALYDCSFPGSSFKIVTAGIMIDSGHDQSYYDTGVLKTPDGTEITNNDNIAMGNVNIETAFIKSLNTYFGQYSMDYQIEFFQGLRRFGVGEKMDLGYLPYCYVPVADDSSALLAAQSGFGQGNIELTPLNLALITQSVETGSITKPIFIKSIIGDNHTLYEDKAKSLFSPYKSDSTQLKIKEMMKKAAESYGITGELYAKTGTAELASGLNRAVYVSFSEDYTVVLCVKETEQYGKDLQSMVMNVFSLIKNYE